jgi:Tfp pilus assembly protein PilF
VTKSHALLGISVAVLVGAGVVLAGTGIGHRDAPSGTAQAAPAGARSRTPVHAVLMPTEGVKSADQLLELGDAYSSDGHYAQAERAYQEALRLEPGDEVATVRLAMVWHADGNSHRATDAIKAVLAQAPDDQEAHYSLAVIYYSQERIDQARSEWAAAVKIDPASTMGRRSQSFVDLLEDQQSAATAGEE